MFRPLERLWDWTSHHISIWTEQENVATKQQLSTIKPLHHKASREAIGGWGSVWSSEALNRMIYTVLLIASPLRQKHFNPIDLLNKDKSHRVDYTIHTTGVGRARVVCRPRALGNGWWSWKVHYLDGLLLIADLWFCPLEGYWLTDWFTDPESDGSLFCV